MVTTTVNAAGTLPQSTITVVSTTGFASPTGTIYILNSSGTQTVAYTGTTTTTFTGCSGGTGAIATGNDVVQSIEQGTTAALILEPKISPAVATGPAIETHGKYSFLNQDVFGSNDIGTTDEYPFVQTIPKPTVATTTNYYKMVGYYTTGATYESFVTTGSPSSSTTTNPNTGHTLVNTFVASFWSV